MAFMDDARKLLLLVSYKTLARIDYSCIPEPLWARLRAATGDVIDDGGAALTACGLDTPSPRPETSSVRRVIEGRRRRREL